MRQLKSETVITLRVLTERLEGLKKNPDKGVNWRDIRRSIDG